MNEQLKKIKLYLQNLAPIKFKNFELTEKNPKDFLVNFLKYNKEYDTVYCSNGRVQTEKNKRRSVGDIYRITSFYFPRVTLTTIYETLLENISENKALSSICVSTKMRVYRATSNNEKCYFNGEKIDEFGVDFNNFTNIKTVRSESGYWGAAYTKEHLKQIKI